MTTPSNILIFGATGVIGKFIIEQLVAAKSNFSRIVIFTSRGTVENKKDEIGRLKEQGVEVVVGDVTNESDVRKAYEGKSPAVSILVFRKMPRRSVGCAWKLLAEEVSESVLVATAELTLVLLQASTRSSQPLADTS